jgi:flagellar assembly protein FliH
MSLRARRLPAGTQVEPFEWGGAAAWGGRSSGSRGSGRRGLQAVGNPEAVAEEVASAHAKGVAEGERAAAAAAEARWHGALQQISSSLKALAEAKAQMQRDAERQIVRLAQAIAARVIHRESTLDPKVLVEIAQRAVSKVGEASRVTVRLNREDVAAAGGPKAFGDGSLTVVLDESLPRGGCRIDSERGTVDASIDAQIQQIAHALLEAGPEEPSAG